METDITTDDLHTLRDDSLLLSFMANCLVEPLTADEEEQFSTLDTYVNDEFERLAYRLAENEGSTNTWN